MSHNWGRLGRVRATTNENQIETWRNRTVSSKLRQFMLSACEGLSPWIFGGRSWNCGMCLGDSVRGSGWGKGAVAPSLFLPTRSSFHLPTSTHPSRDRSACLLQEAFQDDSNKVESLLSLHFSSHTPVTSHFLHYNLFFISVCPTSQLNL